jgi:transposase
MAGPSSPIKIVIEVAELSKLQKIQRGLKAAHSLVLRVTIILLIIAGLSISQVSRKTNVTRNTVKKWAKRYSELGLDGLKDLPRKGCPPDFDAEVAMHIIKIACEMPELRGRSLDKWNCEEIANELIRTKIATSISGESVRRILNVQKLKPWRHHMWLSEKKPRDQEFCDKVRDVCDVYFRPLEAWECVLSVDENTSIQARKRIADMMPAKPGKSVYCEHEYERKGALNLLAAFDTRTGNVYGKCYGRKRQVEFIDFLEYLDAKIPKEKMKIYIVCDNVPMHKGKQVQAWLKKHPRFEFHFTPVHCSWMNQIEQWFSILKRKRLTIANFQSKEDLEKKLYSFISQWNESAHPFRWNEKTRERIERILQKVEERLNEKNAA